MRERRESRERVLKLEERVLEKKKAARPPARPLTPSPTLARSLSTVADAPATHSSRMAAKDFMSQLGVGSVGKGGGVEGGENGGVRESAIYFLFRIHLLCYHGGRPRPLPALARPRNNEGSWLGVTTSPPCSRFFLASRRPRSDPAPHPTNQFMHVMHFTPVNHSPLLPPATPLASPPPHPPPPPPRAPSQPPARPAPTPRPATPGSPGPGPA